MSKSKDYGPIIAKVKVLGFDMFQAVWVRDGIKYKKNFWSEPRALVFVYHHKNQVRRENDKKS